MTKPQRLYPSGALGYLSATLSELMPRRIRLSSSLSSKNLNPWTVPAAQKPRHHYLLDNHPYCDMLHRKEGPHHENETTKTLHARLRKVQPPLDPAEAPRLSLPEVPYAEVGGETIMKRPRTRRQIESSATSLVNTAVRAGKLPRLTGTTLCVDCKEPATGYDHRDYTKPLDVVPVCQKCNLRRGRGRIPVGTIDPVHICQYCWH